MPIYGLRFRALGQTLYHTGPADLAVGDHVLIAADQGQALAQVVSGPYDYVAGVEPESLTPYRAPGHGRRPGRGPYQRETGPRGHGVLPPVHP